MLNDLDSLSQYVDRIIDENNRHQNQVLYLTEEVENLNRNQNLLQAELAALKDQNSKLLSEQNILVNKIEAAQSALNIILSGLSNVTSSSSVADEMNKIAGNLDNISEYTAHPTRADYTDANN